MFSASHTKPTHWPQTNFTRAFFIAAIVQATIVTVLESYVFGQWQAYLRPNAIQVPASRTIPTFLTLLVFASLYSMIFVYDGLRRRSSIQISISCLLNIGLVVYTAIQPDKIHKSVLSMAEARDALNQPLVDLSMDMWGYVKVVLVVLPVVVGVLTVLMGALAWKIHGEFEWEVYRAIAGDSGMKRRFLTYQVYILLLKVDFFFIIGYIAQLAAQVLDIGSVEFITTLCAVPLVFATLILAHFWTTRENRAGTILTAAMLCAALGYFIYKLIVMYTWKDVHYMYEAGFTMLVLFACISAALLFCTILNSILCFCNFGKGLKTYLIPNEKEESVLSYEPSILAYNPPVARRLSLD
ncbi:hypothetical protein BKA65DRAFT_540523 [Rhexocercosporidium sp. MPI-PUGE-AT-0058]|nr:hypothetical protein BKA65DRAFT_540523 [Rhexocercosporidium sp. MPI-PUGE-AT-0058]